MLFASSRFRIFVTIACIENISVRYTKRCLCSIPPVFSHFLLYLPPHSPPFSLVGYLSFLFCAIQSRRQSWCYNPMLTIRLRLIEGSMPHSRVLGFIRGGVKRGVRSQKRISFGFLALQLLRRRGIALRRRVHSGERGWRIYYK